jgi:hypothetical protein
MRAVSPWTTASANLSASRSAGWSMGPTSSAEDRRMRLGRSQTVAGVANVTTVVTGDDLSRGRVGSGGVAAARRV